MGSRGFLWIALVLAVVPLGTGQPSFPARFDVTFALDPAQGTVDVTLGVEDRGTVVSLELDFGGVTTLVGQPELGGSGWMWEGETAIADLETNPVATARWTVNATIAVVSSEGEGHTSYLGPRFAVLKPSDLMPHFQYAFPEGRAPEFLTLFGVDAPAGWTVRGPWPSSGDAFRLDTVIPRGFVAAGVDVEEVLLGSGENAYRVVRLEGAREDAATRDLVIGAESFLSGIYGTSPRHRFIVVAPDPMFKGGLGSPEGVFLYYKADASVVAHELVHTYQAFEPSREPGEATVWLAEGTAVVHGALLEVATGIKTQSEAQGMMVGQEHLAQEKHAVDLSTAVYGSTNEPAAYSKGAVVVSAFNDAIRRATQETYTLADVLRALNEEAAPDTAQAITTDDLLSITARVTGYDLSDFFVRYVTGTEVPPLGALFPGEAAVRVVSTEPSQPVALEPFTVRVALTNLDVEPLAVDLPLFVNGTEAGRVVALLPPGASAEARASVTPLARGTYEVRVEGSALEVRVVAPARVVANVTVWPREITSGAAGATLGVVLQNHGEAPYDAVVQVLLDGQAFSQHTVHVDGGDEVTLPSTLPPLSVGEHTVQVRASEGAVLASRTLAVAAPLPQDSVPGPAALFVLIALAGAARRGRARARSR